MVFYLFIYTLLICFVLFVFMLARMSLSDLNYVSAKMSGGAPDAELTVR